MFSMSGFSEGDPTLIHATALELHFFTDTYKGTVIGNDIGQFQEEDEDGDENGDDIDSPHPGPALRLPVVGCCQRLS